MAKLALITSLLLLAGCHEKSMFSAHINGPKYVVGDCFQSTSPRESWERPMLVEKVVEVGKAKYRTKRVLVTETNGAFAIEDTTSFSLAETYTEKIECPVLYRSVQ